MANNGDHAVIQITAAIGADVKSDLDTLVMATRWRQREIVEAALIAYRDQYVREHPAEWAAARERVAACHGRRIRGGCAA